MPLDRDRPLVFAPEVVLEQFDGEALVLNLSTEEIYSLNRTGAEVAELVRQGLPPRRILQSLSEKYPAAGTRLEREVLTLLEDLRTRRLVVEGESPDAP